MVPLGPEEYDSQPGTPAEEVSTPKVVGETPPVAPEKPKPAAAEKQRKTPANEEKQLSEKGDSGHEDSDFEDNITVTVPPPHFPSGGHVYRDRHMNGRHSRHRHGIDGPNKPSLQVFTD